MDAYLGIILPCSFNFAPANWHLCDGSALNIADYNALYSLIGTTFGGNGSTTFCIPDLRGRISLGSGQYVPMNQDPTVNYPLGQKTGSNLSALPAHTHQASLGTSYMTGTATLSASTSTAGNSAPAPNLVPASFIATDPNGGTPPDVYAYGANQNAVGLEKAIDLNGYLSGASTTILPSGSVSASNMQPYVVVNYMICIVGIYPPKPNQ